MRKYLDEWVPQWTGEGRRRATRTRSRRVSATGSRRRRADDQRAGLVARSTRAWRASPPTSRARSGTRRTPPRYDDAVRRRSRADFNARFLGDDGVYREKTDDAFVQTAQMLPLAFDLVPEERRAPPSPNGWRDDIT